MTASLSAPVVATAKLYLSCARSAFDGLSKNWVLLVASLVLGVLFRAIAATVGGTGSLAGGFVVGLLGVFCISLYYSWISSTIQGEKISFNDLIQFDGGLFNQVMSVAFILWIAKSLLNAFIVTPEVQWVALCIDLGLIVALNAIPEILYLRRDEGISAIQEAFTFVRDNWIEWFFPFLVLTIPVLWSNPLQILLGLTAGSVFLPPWTLVQATGGAIIAGEGLFPLVVTLIIAHWFMLFRGHLFQSLSSGSRRQRAFRERTR